MTSQHKGCPRCLCSFFLSILSYVNCNLQIMCYLCEGRFQCIGYDYLAYIDYMDVAVRYPRKTVKVNHSPMLSGASPLASFTKEVNPRLAKRPLVFNGRLANRRLTSLVKEATVEYRSLCVRLFLSDSSCRTRDVRLLVHEFLWITFLSFCHCRMGTQLGFTMLGTLKLIIL